MPEESRAAKNHAKGFRIWQKGGRRKQKQDALEPCGRGDIVSQAEEIVRRCMAQGESARQKEQENTQLRGAVLTIVLTAIAIAAAVVIVSLCI